MKKIIVICVFLIAIILIIFRLFVLNNKIDDVIIETSNFKNYNIEQYAQISYYANLEKYYIYGTHFNIEGTLNNIYEIFENCNITGFSDVYFEICLQNITDEIKYDLKYNINEELENIEFMLSDVNNGGIYLDDIPVGEYILLLKMNYKTKNELSNEDEMKSCYVSFETEKEYDDIEYYTITKNNQNKKILISYEEKEEVDMIKFSVSSTNIGDEEIYDITLDAGHGGIDVGAVNGNYYESDIVLEYVMLLKEKLEESGLRVKLTRNDDEYVSPYGNDGRAVIPNAVKSKFCFSLHLNSNEETIYNGGVEIYSPNNIDYSFAKLLVNNIINKTNIDVSGNKSYKIEEGIYVRNYTNLDIKEANEYASQNNYVSYNLTTDTPFLFMIRETGGVVTNAYIDGRNKEYDNNEYYNSIQSNESYLLELGYINSPSDLKYILEEKQEYVSAIAKSIISLVNNEV